MKTKISLPMGMIFGRVAIGLLLPFMAYFWEERAIVILVILVVLAFLADIFDGIIARYTNTSTENLRVYDSVADRMFWITVVITCFMLYREFMFGAALSLAILLTLDASVYVLSWIRFSKIPSPHNLLTKVWGILIAIVFIEILAAGSSVHGFNIMFVMGIISRIDSFLIYAVLPQWDHDIPSFFHARAIRKGKEIRRMKLFNG